MPIRSKPGSSLIAFTLLAALSVSGPACLIFQSPSIKALDVKQMPVAVRSPVKAHLVDGSTVVYPYGVTLSGDRINGAGVRYPLGSRGGTGSGSIPLDSIVGMEAYDRQINTGATVLASTGLTIVTAVGSIALFKAIFGSCPTFYADSAGVELLQGEGFSYSVAPLLEQRDVDRLRLSANADGRITLSVRNEALETHYINHVEVIETLHQDGEFVVPDQEGRPIALSAIAAPSSVRDRSGRDVSRAVSASDATVFNTSAATLDKVTEADLDDWIDMEIPVRAGADSVAIVMEMRNSLLNTVLLYDQILGAPGIRSLDFLGKDLENISGAVEMAKWYSSHMGMRISVLDGRSWRQVARIGDSGPIAYHQLAVIVPAVRNGGNTVRVRLAFVADDWRIDAIRASSELRRPATRTLRASRVEMHDPAQNVAALASIADPDEGYLVTSPGTEFRVQFDAGRQTSAGHRTFMLASQGYYTEWVRGSWIKEATGEKFVPSSASLLKAIRSWRGKQEQLEQQFYTSRIATR